MPRAYPGRYAEAVVEGSTSSWPWQRWRDVARIQAPQIPHQQALGPPFDPSHPLARLPTIRPTFLSPFFLHASSSSPYPPRTTAAVSPWLPPHITARGAAWGAAAGAAAAGVSSEAALVLVSLALLLSLWNRQLRRSTSGSCQQYSLDEVQRATDYFAEENKIGTGGFAHVYRGTSPFNPDSLWAVKRCTVPTEHFGRVVREMSNKIHPNLVRLIGCCNDFNEGEGRHEQIVICELMPGGSIHSRFSRDSRDPLTLQQRLDILIGVARGLEFLHSFGIVHRDIKPANILLDSNMQVSPTHCVFSLLHPPIPHPTPLLHAHHPDHAMCPFSLLSQLQSLKAKISAFGAVRMGYDEHMVQSMGTHGYIDPASRANRNARPSADVYSFGVVMLEMLTGRKAVEWDGNADSSFKGWVVQCLYDRNVALIGDPHLKAPDSVVVRMADLALPCLAMPPDSRPSMARVIHDLEAVKLFIASQWPDLVHCSPDAARSADGASGELSSGEAAKLSDFGLHHLHSSLYMPSLCTCACAATNLFFLPHFSSPYLSHFLSDLFPSSRPRPPAHAAARHVVVGSSGAYFGIVMLELLTGHRVVFILDGGGPMNIKEWVEQRIASGDISAIGDPFMRAPDSLVLRMARLALRCTAALTAARPTMGEAATELEILKKEFFGLESGRMAQRVDEQMQSLRLTHRDLREELQMIAGIESNASSATGRRLSGGRVDEQMQSLRLTHRDLREELQMIAGIESSASSATGRRLSGGIRREEEEAVWGRTEALVETPACRPQDGWRGNGAKYHAGRNSRATVHSAVCVSNSGRPAASALHDLVAAAADAFLAGHSLQRLQLQLQYGGAEGEEFRMSEAGYRLTSSEQLYRTQWIKTVYLTMYRLHLQQPGSSFISMPTSSSSGEEPWLGSIVDRVLEGQRTGEEQSLVHFDRALATAGASGGVAAERRVIAPQWLPISQLVLLTCKVANERRGPV
ncbi:unnamed protein product [Closterium sp. Yama58-4]|nr:unnamed protein product [Closterium sp. Yama58-4]